MSINQRLAEQLDRVSRGEAVNMQSMARQLMESGAVHFTDIQSIFSYNASVSDPRMVKVQDKAAFEWLRQRFPVDALASRLSAALAGDSHRVGVSGCMVIMDGLRDERPAVCVVRDTEAKFPWPIGQTLIVVENEELMLQKSLLHALLTNHCDIPHEKRIDLMLGGGNRASSRYHGLIYDQYEEVYFLLDLDLGGLKAFNSILSLSGNPENFHFLLPRNIEQILSSYSEQHRNNRLSASQRKALEKYVGFHSEMERAVGLIAKYQCMPEQEVYLALMEISLGE